MKLKTLKDFTRFIPTKDYEGTICPINLKAEAIKWVKSHEKSYYTTINWILHFFNITEEDLK